jgi:hypothetical protein
MIEFNRNPSQRDLRWFGLLLLPFFALISAWLSWRHGSPYYFHSPLLTFAVLGLSAVAAIVALAAPQRLRWVYVGWMLAAYPIGWTVSHVLMAIIFFLVITPFGAIMRATGYDPMQRRFDRNATTYWEPRPTAPENKRYFRQF